MSTLPPSRISEYQDKIQYPEGVFEKFPDAPAEDATPTHSDKDTMYLYSSQIMLRIVLNEAHNSLYNSKWDPLLLADCYSALNSWHNWQGIIYGRPNPRPGALVPNS
jgi:hypothetical protein